MTQATNNAIATAFDTLKKEYANSGQPYEIGTHPYFSTGGFPFEVVGRRSSNDVPDYEKLVLVCRKGTRIEFFSYAQGEIGSGAGLSPKTPSTAADTNIIAKHATNNEDYAIEGISASSRGVRLEMVGRAGHEAFLDMYSGDGQGEAWMDGSECIVDPSSQHVPPEIGSPLALHDALFQAIASRVSLAPTFDRKATDTVARLDKFPEGGGKSYLYSHGEPSFHNFYRLMEGYVWRQSSAQSDKIFSLVATMEHNTYFICTQPNPWRTGETGSTVVSPYIKRIVLEWTIFLHGRAFYVPSKNI